MKNKKIVSLITTLAVAFVFAACVPAGSAGDGTHGEGCECEECCNKEDSLTERTTIPFTTFYEGGFLSVSIGYPFLSLIRSSEELVRAPIEALEEAYSYVRVGDRLGLIEDLQKFDDAFFTENALIVCLFSEGYTAGHIWVDAVYTQGETKILHFNRGNSSDVPFVVNEAGDIRISYNMTPSQWVFLIEVQKVDIGDCSKIQAEMYSIDHLFWRCLDEKGEWSKISDGLFH